MTLPEHNITLDLSGLKVGDIPTEVIEADLRTIRALTTSNLEATAKWEAILRIIDGTLRTVNMSVKIASLL